MKLIPKLMLQWVLVYAVMLIGVLLLGVDWTPVLDAYHDMSARQIAVYAVMATLFVAWLLIVWHDGKEFRATNRALSKSQVHRPVTKPAQLELMYPSVLSDRTVYVPVMGVIHAQDLINVMRLKQAQVGYRNKTTGETSVLYQLNEVGRLVQP